MPRKLDSALRWRIVFLHINHRISPKDICEILSLSESFVYNVLRLYRDTKGVEDNAHGWLRRNTRIINGRVILRIRELLEQYPELFLEEVRDWIEYETGVRYSLTTMSRYLRRIGLSIKKLQIVAKERDEIRRAEFRRFMSQFERKQLLFIYESSKDERTFQRKYAQSLKGSRISRKGNSTRGTRYSILAAISVDGVKSAHAIVGAYNRTEFELAMEHFVIPYVGSYAQHEKCSIVILDNCAIHYSGKVLQLIREKGGMLVFLPPYSPDMNPIELCFGEGKSWLKRHQDVCEVNPQRCFEMALNQIPPYNCSQYFSNCGYM